MSIIQDALKKAEKAPATSSTVAQIAPQVVDVPKVAPVSLPKKETAKRIEVKSVLLALLFLAILVFIASKYFSPSSPAPMIPQHTKTVQPITTKVSAPDFESNKIFELPKTLGRPEYNLIGIVQLGSEYRAIINEQSVVVGDQIGDAVVSRITADSVILRRGDSETTLQIK